MSRFRVIKGRLGRAEGTGGGDDRPVPNVLRVGMFETRVEAFARFNAAYPHRKPGHNVLVVPAKPSTPEEIAIYEARFFESQNRLVAEARSNRIAVVADQPAPQPSFPQGGAVAPPKGRNFTQWVRNT